MNLQSALLARVSDAAACARTPDPELGFGLIGTQEIAGVDPIVTAALLVTGAFRMRDEVGLIAPLRLLTEAVAAW